MMDRQRIQLDPPAVEPSPVIEHHEAGIGRIRGLAEKLDHEFVRAMARADIEVADGMIKSNASGAEPPGRDAALSFIESFDSKFDEISSELWVAPDQDERVESLCKFMLEHAVTDVASYFEPAKLIGISHVELLVELLFGGSSTASGVQSTRPESEVLGELGVMLMFRGMAFAIADGDVDRNDEVAVARRDLLMSIRTGAALMRGQTWPMHGRAIAEQIFGCHDDDLKRVCGFGVFDVIHFGEAISALLNRRLLLRGLAPSALDVLAFSSVDVATDHLDQQVVTAMLAAFSVDAPEVPKPPSLGAIWSRRPLLRIDEDRHLLISTTSLLNDVHVLVESILNERGIEYRQSRDDNLEAMVARLFARSVPSASVATGGIYLDERNEECENDVLVQTRRELLVVECKAHRLDDDLAELDPDAALNIAVDAVHAGLTQARRFNQALEAAGVLDVRAADGSELQIDASEVDVLLPINVTLSPMTSMQIQAGTITQLATFESYQPGHSLYLGDLMCLLDLVESPDELLCYLAWRTSLPIGKWISAADELDLFGWFRYRTNSVGAILSEGHTMFNLANSATDFDSHFIRLDAGMDSRPPTSTFATCSSLTRWARARFESGTSGWLDEVLAVRTAGASALGTLAGILNNPGFAEEREIIVDGALLVVAPNRRVVKELAIGGEEESGVRRVIGVSPVGGNITGALLHERVMPEKQLGTALL